MDSSINTAKPYKEKAPPRRRAPVRNPRPKKEPEPGFTSTPKVGLIQRIEIDKLQAKLTAETEKVTASAIAIQNAIRSNLARKMVKTTRASTPKVKKIKNEIVAKKIKNEILPKVTTPATTTAKPKKERKARVPRTPKPVYKMSYTAALKEWNISRGNAMWCNPRKNSDDYNAVQQLRM